MFLNPIGLSIILSRPMYDNLSQFIWVSGIFFLIVMIYFFFVIKFKCCENVH